MSRNQRRDAFTLVELLVVIGIIGILVSILIPVINSARRSAQASVCMSNMRQLGIGIQAYANRDRGWLPQKGPDGSNAKSESFTPHIPPYNLDRGYDDPSIWFNAIPPLINDRSYYEMLLDNEEKGLPLPRAEGSPSVFVCVTQSGSATIGGNDRIVGDYFLLYGVDSSGRIKNSTGLVPLGNFQFAMGYVWNSKLTSTISAPTATSIKMSDLQNASSTVLMVEKITNPGEYLDKAVQAYNQKYPGVFGGKIDKFGYDNNLAQSKADWRRFTTRHNHGGHLLFADGHVSWFAWTDVQIQPDQMPYNANVSDANHPGVIWSALGPVN